jgi:hypothetical protein
VQALLCKRSEDYPAQALGSDAQRNCERRQRLGAESAITAQEAGLSKEGRAEDLERVRNDGTIPRGHMGRSLDPSAEQDLGPNAPNNSSNSGPFSNGRISKQSIEHCTSLVDPLLQYKNCLRFD